jgi:hypothetical protein
MQYDGAEWKDKLVLADMVEERGDTGLAFGLRWTARYAKRPFRTQTSDWLEAHALEIALEGRIRGMRDLRWGWRTYGHYGIADCIYDGLPGMRHYETEEEAYRALGATVLLLPQCKKCTVQKCRRCGGAGIDSSEDPDAMPLIVMAALQLPQSSIGLAESAAMRLDRLNPRSLVLLVQRMCRAEMLVAKDDWGRRVYEVHPLYARKIIAHNTGG